MRFPVALAVLLAAFLCMAAPTDSCPPVLRIAVMSDIQGYPYPEDAGMRNLERVLDVFTRLKPDMILNVGDINDGGCDVDAVKYYKARCDARLGDLPQIACLGNHELCFIPPELKAVRTPARCLADFNAVFGEGPGQLVHKVLFGYDFIALSPADGNGYRAVDMPLLKTALDRAVRRDATKPIFVLTHFHPYDTVASSQSRENDGGLRELMDHYPQIVNLSGHSHVPLQDPRTIWQGAFTVLETSTLCYGCEWEGAPMANQISSLIAYGHEAVGFLFLEVTPNEISVHRYSASSGKEIAEPWRIALPYDPAHPKYAFAARATTQAAPRFPKDPEPTLWYDYGFVYLKFIAAENPDDVYFYRVELSEEGGAVKSYPFLSDFYRDGALRQPRVCVRLPPKSVRAGGKYRCRIVPVGFFGQAGAPCDWSFEIRGNYPVAKHAPNCVPE